MEELRKKWKLLLTGGENPDFDNAQVQRYVESVDELSVKMWDSLLKSEERSRMHCLFADMPLTDKVTRTGSSQITLTFDRLKAIVLGYETKGAALYHRADVRREIISGLALMMREHYSLDYAFDGSWGEERRWFGNWYDWRIGSPRQLCDLFLMFYEELDRETLAEYVNIIMANNKAADATGANQVWIANIFIQCGILADNPEWIEKGRKGMESVFRFVESGDGFYRDGSFIQHGFYAYTGGYGKALLCTLAPVMYVLHGTPYAIAYEDKREQIFYDMLFEAYAPLIYGGRFMDMAREREISRVANQDSIPGRQAIRAILLLTEVLPKEQKERAKAMVKEWLLDEEVLDQVCLDPIGGFNEYYLPAGVIGKALELIHSDVEPSGKMVLHKQFTSMNRVVHLRKNYGFTISMSSGKIKNTEGTNDEGLRLWHIGDGLTYLYNADKEYYSDHYWATVDYQRLPGTTVNRVPDRDPKEGYDTFNPCTFAGGTKMGPYGIAGMELQGVGDQGRNGAHARKSWFLFDDEIVAVGSDISSELENSPVETIVENRKISENRLLVNGEEPENFNGLHKKTRWIHLAGKTADSDVGYYFPTEPDLMGVREQRTGAWNQVNTYAKFVDDEIRTNRFVTFWFDHGVKPVDGTYTYVILPGKSAEETAHYSENPEVEILRLDSKVHVVRQKRLGIIGINFFEAGSFGPVHAERPMSVMLRVNAAGEVTEISCY